MLSGKNDLIINGYSDKKSDDCHGFQTESSDEAKISATEAL
jgi:hypothetical protein